MSKVSHNAWPDVSNNECWSDPPMHQIVDWPSNDSSNDDDDYNDIINVSNDTNEVLDWNNRIIDQHQYQPQSQHQPQHHDHVRHPSTTTPKTPPTSYRLHPSNTTITTTNSNNNNNIQRRVRNVSPSSSNFIHDDEQDLLKNISSQQSKRGIHQEVDFFYEGSTGNVNYQNDNSPTTFGTGTTAASTSKTASSTTDKTATTPTRRSATYKPYTRGLLSSSRSTASSSVYSNGTRSTATSSSRRSSTHGGRNSTTPTRRRHQEVDPTTVSTYEQQFVVDENTKHVTFFQEEEIPTHQQDRKQDQHEEHIVEAFRMSQSSAMRRDGHDVARPSASVIVTPDRHHHHHHHRGIEGQTQSHNNKNVPVIVSNARYSSYVPRKLHQYEQQQPLEHLRQQQQGPPAEDEEQYGEARAARAARLNSPPPPEPATIMNHHAAPNHDYRYNEEIDLVVSDDLPSPSPSPSTQSQQQEQKQTQSFSDTITKNEIEENNGTSNMNIENRLQQLERLLALNTNFQESVVQGLQNTQSELSKAQETIRELESKVEYWKETCQEMFETQHQEVQQLSKEQKRTSAAVVAAVSTNSKSNENNAPIMKEKVGEDEEDEHELQLREKQQQQQMKQLLQIALEEFHRTELIHRRKLESTIKELKVWDTCTVTWKIRDFTSNMSKLSQRRWESQQFSIFGAGSTAFQIVVQVNDKSTNVSDDDETYDYDVINHTKKRRQQKISIYIVHAGNHYSGALNYFPMTLEGSSINLSAGDSGGGGGNRLTSSSSASSSDPNITSTLDTTNSSCSISKAYGGVGWTNLTNVYELQNKSILYKDKFEIQVNVRIKRPRKVTLTTNDSNGSILSNFFLN